MSSLVTSSLHLVLLVSSLSVEWAEFSQAGQDERNSALCSFMLVYGI